MGLWQASNNAFASRRLYDIKAVKLKNQRIDGTIYLENINQSAMVGALKVKEGLIQSGQIYQSAQATTRLRHTQHLFLIASIAMLEPPFMGFLLQITQGEALSKDETSSLSRLIYGLGVAAEI